MVVVLTVHLMFGARIQSQTAISMLCYLVRIWTGLTGFMDFLLDGLVCLHWLLKWPKHGKPGIRFKQTLTKSLACCLFSGQVSWCLAAL